MKRYICYLTYFVFGIVFLSNTQAQYFTAPGVGYEGQGADIAFYSIDDNPALELFAFAYDHVQGGNTIRYRIGWNINSYGYTDIWSSKPIYGPSLGHEGQGLGAIITQIDDNPRPDMIVMVYDNPEGPNTFRYKIGWNIQSNGYVEKWSSTHIEIPGVGYEGQGAAISAFYIDDNQKIDLLFMAYDNPEGPNTFRYRIGWNLQSNGYVEKSSSTYIEVPGVGYEGQGAGAAMVNIDNNPRPDIIVMVYDNPEGSNTFRYKIGWNIQSNGYFEKWSSTHIEIPGVGYEGQGAGISALYLDKNPRPDLIFMAYDNPEKDNTFRYKIGWNIGIDGKYDYDLAAVDWKWEKTDEGNLVVYPVLQNLSIQDFKSTQRGEYYIAISLFSEGRQSGPNTIEVGFFLPAGEKGMLKTGVKKKWDSDGEYGLEWHFELPEDTNKSNNGFKTWFKGNELDSKFSDKEFIPKPK